MSGPVKDYVCLDLETSGLYPKYDKIIEIGAVKVKNGQITDRFRSLVNPGRKLTEITTAITGIHDGDLVSAPDITEILPSFLSFSEALPLLGHSILFDYSFIKKAAVNQGIVL